MLNGRRFRFTGLNIYNANSRDNCWYSLGTGGQLDRDLIQIGSGQEVFRAWFFQRLATRNGRRDWTAFDHTLKVARAHNQRVIVTLANQWGDCENSVGQPVYKTEGWYRNGYKTIVDRGSRVSYRKWVSEIVRRYRNDPTILAWQMMNEAEARKRVGGECAATAETTVRAWARDVAVLIKSIDPHHLVSLGTIGNGQCGTSTGTSFERLHAIPQIDLCEYHDYDRPAEAMPGDHWNGLFTRLRQCAALRKPMFVGESGLRTDDTGSFNARAKSFGQKFRAQFRAGVVGILLWDWRASSKGGSSGGGYEIGPGDPVLGLLKSY